jgi:hypothetical protein
MRSEERAARSDARLQSKHLYPGPIHSAIVKMLRLHDEARSAQHDKFYLLMSSFASRRFAYVSSAFLLASGASFNERFTSFTALGKSPLAL